MPIRKNRSRHLVSRDEAHFNRRSSTVAFQSSPFYNTNQFHILDDAQLSTIRSYSKCLAKTPTVQVNSEDIIVASGLEYRDGASLELHNLTRLLKSLPAKVDPSEQSLVLDVSAVKDLAHSPG